MLFDIWEWVRLRRRLFVVSENIVSYTLSTNCPWRVVARERECVMLLNSGSLRMRQSNGKGVGSYKVESQGDFLDLSKHISVVAIEAVLMTIQTGRDGVERSSPKQSRFLFLPPLLLRARSPSITPSG